MRVVVPHAANQARNHPGLFPETIEALELHSPVKPTYVDCSDRDDAYFELLQRSFDQDGDLVLIEHDIVVHAGVFHAFRYCPHPWCAFPYLKDGRPLIGLGCTRFRAGMLEHTRGVWGLVARHGNDAEVGDGMPARHWVRCDVRLDAELMQLEYVWRGNVRTYRPHEHGPLVGHLNPGGPS